MVSSTQNIELFPKKTNQKELALSCFCNTSTYIFGDKYMRARDRDWDVMKGSKEGRELLNQNSLMDKTAACLNPTLKQTTRKKELYIKQKRPPH